MPLYLGIDSSTQSMTGVVIDTDSGSMITETSINFDEHFGSVYGVTNGVVDLGQGVVHSYPLMWIDALEALFEALKRDGCALGEIAAIAGSGQQHGTVYLNASAADTLSGLEPGTPLSQQLQGIFSRKTAPIWMDSSTAQQCREIEEGVGGTNRLLNLTGNTAFERFSGPQIRKFYQDEPEAYEQTAYTGLVSSYVASVLAGKLVSVDVGDASGTNMMDIRSKTWSPSALDATAPGLSDRLTPVTASGSPAGTIHPYFVAAHGFSSDCTVLPFSGDNPCSLIGLGLVESGHVALSLGTSDTLFACMAEPRVSTEGEGCVFASPDDAHYMALICYMNGSLAREAVRDQFGLDWGGFTAALETSLPGNDGKMMLPFFDPEIVPNVGAGVVRRHLEEEDAAGNIRAVIEAQAVSSHIHSRWMGLDITSLYVTGGASANEEILKVFANVHGCPVHRFETTNAAGLGAAIRAYHGHQPSISWPDACGPFCQPVAGSTIQPDPSTRSTYDDLIEAYSAFEREHVAS
ncbi:TPA: carbohydrate kinase [Candidatus Latescibacteria bacterium]|nr:carbohydrate kinase [Candidatus Latescibacterota bacterium]